MHHATAGHNDHSSYMPTEPIRVGKKLKFVGLLLSISNAFVFLMADEVIDYTEIGLLWSNIDKRTAM